MSGAPTAFAQGVQIAAATAAALTGASLAEVCARIGRTPGEIADPVARVPHAALVEVWTRLSAGHDDFGLQAARRVGTAGRSLVDYAMMSAPDLGGMLTTLVRFQRWMHEASVHALRCEGSRATLRLALAPPWALPPAVWDFLAATAALRGMLLAGEAAAPVRVCLPRGPHADRAGVAALFRAEVVYRAGAAEIEWSRAALARSVVARDDALHRALARQLEVTLGLAGAAGVDAAAEDGHAEVRRVLAAGLLRGEVTLAAVARALGVSTRSLQRRLARAGTSFQAELDAVRRALAQRLLVEPGASVKAVAYSLGFSQVPAFTRAFRRWTGTAPHAFMRAGHGGRAGVRSAAR